jgi:hypothetical protein
MATKQDEIVVPNPPVMISSDGEGKESEQLPSPYIPCTGSVYATAYAKDNDSTGVWVLQGSAENHRKWDEVVRDYKARVPVYNRKDRPELLRLAGAVYYENGERVLV